MFVSKYDIDLEPNECIVAYAHEFGDRYVNFDLLDDWLATAIAEEFGLSVYIRKCDFEIDVIANVDDPDALGTEIERFVKLLLEEAADETKHPEFYDRGVEHYIFDPAQWPELDVVDYADNVIIITERPADYVIEDLDRYGFEWYVEESEELLESYRAYRYDGGWVFICRYDSTATVVPDSMYDEIKDSLPETIREFLD